MTLPTGKPPIPGSNSQGGPDAIESVGRSAVVSTASSRTVSVRARGRSGETPPELAGVDAGATSARHLQSHPGGPGGFTLIELLLVMAMLLIVMSVSAPLLVRFFHGRSLDSEARRFLALTRYGQSRAVSEGVPMVLWIDTELGLYGLEEEHTYTYSTRDNEDGKAVEFEVAKDVDIEVEQLPVQTRTISYKEPRPQSGRRQPEIRFTPEGFISDASPDLIVFRQLGPEGAELREEAAGEIYIGRTDHRLNYEIKTNIVLRARR